MLREVPAIVERMCEDGVLEKAGEDTYRITDTGRKYLYDIDTGKHTRQENTTNE